MCKPLLADLGIRRRRTDPGRRAERQHTKCLSSERAPSQITCFVSLTSSRREHRDHCRWGMSAGKKTSAARISDLPSSVDEVEEEGQSRLLASTHLAPEALHTLRASPLPQRMPSVQLPTSLPPVPEGAPTRRSRDWGTKRQGKSPPPPRRLSPQTSLTARKGWQESTPPRSSRWAGSGQIYSPVGRRHRNQRAAAEKP